MFWPLKRYIVGWAIKSKEAIKNSLDLITRLQRCHWHRPSGS